MSTFSLIPGATCYYILETLNALAPISIRPVVPVSMNSGPMSSIVSIANMVIVELRAFADNSRIVIATFDIGNGNTFTLHRDTGHTFTVIRPGIVRSRISLLRPVKFQPRPTHLTIPFDTVFRANDNWRFTCPLILHDPPYDSPYIGKEPMFIPGHVYITYHSVTTTERDRVQHAPKNPDRLILP